MPIVRVIWYTAMSIDGRIAGPHDNLDFLATIDPQPETEEGGFRTFLAGIDAVVVGATTLRWLLDGGHGWPHGDLPTWLLSHDPGLVSRIGPTPQPLERWEGDIERVFAEIEARGHDRVWLCGGGDVAGQALAADRIDEVDVTIAPTVLGSGPSLFDGSIASSPRFRLARCTASGDTARLTWVRDRADAGRADLEAPGAG